MRRLRSVERVAPGTLSGLIDALRIREDRAEPLRADPVFDVFETGGLAERPATARLRKRLIAAQLDSRVDHRSAAYRQAANTVRLHFRSVGAGRADEP